MFERFAKESGALVVQAREEARLDGETKLEAEHLLLASSRHAAWSTGGVLAQAGLDHDGLRHAFDAERERSLDAAGITVHAVGPLERPLPATGQPRWGASAKRALERAVSFAQGRGDRQILPTHILLGVLRADEGTVPRALAGAGVDAVVLAASVEATLR